VSPEEEKNMALVRRFWEAHAKENLDTLDEQLAPDFVDHSSFANQEPGREGYMQQVAEQIAAFSEVRCIIEDQLAKGKKVVTSITWRSIHDRGEYFGLMPRGKEVEVTSMAMHRILGARSLVRSSTWSARLLCAACLTSLRAWGWRLTAAACPSHRS
jgi:predicted ester cyclase